MDNQYLGDMVSENGIRSLGIYGFAQIKGSLGQFKEGTSRLTYVAGFGLSNQSYRQGDEEFSFGFVVRNSHWLIPFLLRFRSAWEVNYHSIFRR